MDRFHPTRMVIAAALYLSLSGPALAGISDGFGEALMLAFLLEIAFYSVYLVAFIAVILLWRKGKKRLAGAVIAITLTIGVIFPLAHQARYNVDTESLREASILPDNLDLSGKRVLAVHSWSSCHDLCEMLLTHRRTEALYSVPVGYKDREAFENTGILPDKAALTRLNLNADGRVARTQAERADLAKIDYVILLDFDGEFGASLAERYSDQVPAESVGLQFLFAPIEGAEVVRPATLKPDVLVFYQRGRTWGVPTHPRHRPNATVMNYSERNLYLGKLFCPAPNARIYNDCKVKRDNS